MNKKRISIIVPTLNEENTIEQFIRWCLEGLRISGHDGEIIIVDSSTDLTPSKAENLGVKVLRLKERGLGKAYRFAQNKFDGDYCILGDADCTYDFREIDKFIFKLEEGFDFVIGDRFKGKMEKKAMPFIHRYFGSPLTSFVFRKLNKIHVNDIHCGMRAMTKEVFDNLAFEELGWEYAPDMIINAAKLNAKITEIPINYLTAPNGRKSHLQREGWMTPIKAGIGSLRVSVKNFKSNE